MFENWESFETPWENWPEARLFSLPLILSCLIYGVLFFGHVLHPTHEIYTRFQILYMRLVGALPLLIALMYVEALYPWTSELIEFILSIIEGYLLYGMFVLILGLGHLKSDPDVASLLMTTKFTRAPFSRCGLNTCKFSTPERALRFWSWLNFQFVIVRPIVTLIPFVMESPTRLLRGSLRFIGFLTLFVSIYSILMVYRTMSLTVDGFKDYEMFHKFLLIKLLFGFVILNGVILYPMIEDGRIPIPGYICEPILLEESTLGFCIDRYLAVIYMIQVMFLMIPCLFFFHRKDFEQNDEDTHQYPIYKRFGYFICRIFYICDLGYFTRVKVMPQHRTNNNKDSLENVEGHSNITVTQNYNS